MKININELVVIYARAMIEIDSVYELLIPPSTKAIGTKTMEGVCGFVVPVKGRARFTIKEQVYELEPGVIFHAGSNLSLDKEVIGDSQWEYVLVHYRITENKKDKNYLEKLHYCLYIGMNHYSDIITLAHKLYRSEKNPRSISELKSKVLFYSFLESIFQNAQVKNCDSDERIIESSMRFIESNFDKNLSINDLAEKHNMDNKRFYYVFQKYAGIGPKQYIMRCRINNAKEMLVKERYSITEIANMVGYEDTFYFSRMFKKNTGVSPTIFRERFGKNPW
jgi:YesN/AraC family two-component response regulator